MKNNIGIVWLREDFRLSKNEALSYASRNHDNVVAIYVFKEKEISKQRESQRWWIHESLINFKKKLLSLNINLEVAESNSYKNFFDKIVKKKIFQFTGTKYMNLNF